MKVNAIKMLEIWKKCIGQEWIQLNEERTQKLSSLLQDHLQNDLSAWERLCEQVKATRFLMGEGPSGWKITLDWVLNPINLFKILEGKFYDQKCANSEKESHFSANEYIRGAEDFSPHRKAQIQAALSQIKDQTWKKWCAQLNFNPYFRGCVLPWQLESIVNARFLGVEEGRLVWISCADYLTLNRVEELRSQLLSVIQRTYPTVRAIRTCLAGEDPLREGTEEEPSYVFSGASQTKDFSGGSSSGGAPLECPPLGCLKSKPLRVDTWDEPLLRLGQIAQTFQSSIPPKEILITTKIQKEEEEDEDSMNFYEEEDSTRESSLCLPFIISQKNSSLETDQRL